MRTRHPRLRLLAVVLSLSGLLAATAPVHASTPPLEVSLVGCAFGNGGVATVPAGTAFDVRSGWATNKLWQEVMFLFSVKVDAAVNGVPIARTFRYWTLPEYNALNTDYPWVMYWRYPHAALGLGESITVHFQDSLRFAVFDGFSWTPKGLLSTQDCVITGV